MKLKRAEKIITRNGFNETTHPALCALADFAAQNPGLEFVNYGTAQSYKQEMRGISNDWRRFKAAVAEAGAEMVTDASIIAAAPHAFSGRLTWEPIGMKNEPAQGFMWHYCIGQYWPTEYRKAATAVLEQAIRDTRRNRPASKGIPQSIAELQVNTETKFTPGPWIIRKTGHNLYIGHEKPNTGYPDRPYLEQVLPRPFPEQRSSCKRGESPSWYGWPEKVEANAALIAAAPEMFAALEALLTASEIVDGCEPDPLDIEHLHKAHDQARAAISKAKGGA